MASGCNLIKYLFAARFRSCLFAHHNLVFSVSSVFKPVANKWEAWGLPAGFYLNGIIILYLLQYWNSIITIVIQYYSAEFSMHSELNSNTVPSIRQELKRNDDSVSVEELDWSAERQVLIPAEHLWCDFKCRPWAKNSSPNTNDLCINYMDTSTGTPPSLEEKRTLPNCVNKETYVLTNVFPPLLQQFWSVWNDCTHVQVIGVWWWVFGSRSAFKVTPEVFSWDQDLSFCRPVKFFHTDWIIISLWSLPYTQRHCHVRIEKGPNFCYKIRSTQFPRISLYA